MYVAYSTRNYKYMLDDLSSKSIKERDPEFDIAYSGNMEVIYFPDGETYHRLNEDDIIGKDVLIVGGTHTSDDLMDIFDIGCSVIKHGAKSLTIFIPYYGYSTMERAVKTGEIVKAKTRARLLSSIPSGSRPNRIVFLDLHTEGIPHYLEGNVQPIHMYAKDIIIKVCSLIALKYGDNFVLGSTDAGRAKWIESLSNDMSVDCAIITKRRISGSSTDISSINADVKGRVVIIYDDMIRTGGSVIKAASKYMEAGASCVHVVATHGVLPGNSLLNIFESGFVTSVTVTDSHPRAVELFRSNSIPYDYNVVPIAKYVRVTLCNHFK